VVRLPRATNPALMVIFFVEGGMVWHMDFHNKGGEEG
jgi:hypothetical protein